ncbi:MAG: hypothetical protein FJ023_06610 [Chloroflexi bacterium]|nr:hypothetical protein [Chloroflexota bacterium]
MRKSKNIASLSILLIAALLLSLMPLVSVKLVSAVEPSILSWSIVDTPRPGLDNNVIASPSEINVIAIGSDDRTFYAVDIPGDPPGGTYPDGKLRKSTDGGVTWLDDLTRYLTAAGANLPVWNIAVAPDDVNFLVAVTDVPGGPLGPQRVFVSKNGGATWDMAITGLALGVGEYISCVDISMDYGGQRDIAIGTRDGTGAANGRVWVMKVAVGVPSWVDQNLPPSDVVALKFSPTYVGDSSLVVVSSTAAGTHLNLGIHDTVGNTTTWNTTVGYPAGGLLITVTNAGQVITGDLELPSDFSGQTPSLRRYYVSLDAFNITYIGDIYRIDDTVVSSVRDPNTGRISSIAYRGTYGEGVLLAGEVAQSTISPGKVRIWRTSNPNATVGMPTWYQSNDLKSPTGGANSNFANAQLAWSPDGTRAYCGTSSANPTAGGTAWAVTQWPRAWLNSVALDESAFSVSPYAPAYGQLLSLFDMTVDTDIGNIWNQLSLIDTQLSLPIPFNTSFFSDVAVLEVPVVTEEGIAEDYNVLYLASINPDVGGWFDSIWRSTSDPLGRTWERILCINTTNNDLILRVKSTAYDEEVRSRVIVGADVGTDWVVSSEDERQAWLVSHLTNVTDLALASDEFMYILNNAVVYRYNWIGNSWSKTHDVDTFMGSGHTIAVPLKNPANVGVGTADWVIVGEAGPPAGSGRVAYADFSALALVKFEPPLDKRVDVPIVGNAHVIADDRFEQNKIVYTATHDITGNSGKIYRWTIDESTDWDVLGPPNSAFYGLAMRNGVLYGAWNIPTAPPPTPSPPGVDRTLFSRAHVPPLLEWDYLTAGLPPPPNSVLFTREPSALKVSSNDYNGLWAIDDTQYDWTSRAGCLWTYVDMVAVLGPWTTTPPSGDFIPVDPVSGRANEVNFGWRQLSYASVYELQLAKDSDFNMVVLLNDDIIPADQLAPACYFSAGGLVPLAASASSIASWGNLESGHTYYWRVRARAAATGEIVRSPWSATMYFTVMAGLPVRTKYPTLTLFSPPYGVRGAPRSPGFSWSSMPGTTKYEFVLAKDAAMTQVVVKDTVSTTSYDYGDKLDWNTTYFWQVKAMEPAVSDASPIGIFTVIAEEKPAETGPTKPLPVPSWVWAVIAVCFALVAAIIAFAMVRPRYAIRPSATSATADGKLEPIVGKQQNPIARLIGRWRYLRKR